MPPEITAGPSSTAGLMALAAAPPGIAVITGPSLPEPLSASLFAVFLAQSGSPDLTTAPPSADIQKSGAQRLDTQKESQTVGADPKPAPLILFNPKNLPFNLKNLKTMDTLPTLPFPPALKAKNTASELPLHLALIHLPLADDRLTDDRLAALASPSALPLPVQAAFVPPVLNVLALPIPTASSAVPYTVPTPAVPTPSASVPTLAVPAVSSASPGLPVVAAPTLTAPTPAVPVLASAAPALAVPALPSRSDTPHPQTPAPAVLLPLTPTQTAPLQPLPLQPLPLQPLPLPVPQAFVLAPQPVTAKVSVGKPAPVVTLPLPRVVSPVQNALLVPIPQAQTGPQGQPAPSLLPIPAIAPAAMPAAVTVPAAQSGLTSAAGASPRPEPSRTVPAKTAGKLVAATLRPATENADTSTRTVQAQILPLAAKTAVPAAAPEPTLTPEKHAPEPDASAAVGSAKNSALLTTPPATDAPRVEAKPLSAADRAEIVRQAADGVGTMPAPEPGAAQQMSVHLHPKDWGRLEVSVTLTPSQDAGAVKTVTAHIVAETPQVKAALQSGTGALHQALRASGLHLEHLTVSIRTPEAKPAAQNASAKLPSGQSQPDKSGQSYGQSNSGAGSGTNGSGSGFGTGGSPSNRQGQPQAFMPAMTDTEPDDIPAARLPLRPAAGRIDTHA